MKLQDEVMLLRERQAFWSGVVRGVIGTLVGIASLTSMIYYVIEIYKSVKGV